jgi:peptide/nickel transport system substrate-binding protein
MIRLRRVRIALIVAGILIALGTACRRRTSSSPSNDLLIVGYDREPDTLNRFSTHILEDIQTCVVEGLTITDENMQVVPLLAREVPTVANGGVVLRADRGMDVTWRLRPGIHWHDGTPLTSADVKFTVDAINSPGYNPESTDGFDRIASVDTPDPQTAVIHYREIYAPYDIQFIRGMLPKHVLDGRDIDRAQDYNRAPLGTGPYRVLEWKAGEHILLERVPHYWRGDEFPKIQRLQFKFVANTNTRVNQLKAGEVHIVALVPWDKYRELTSIPSVVVHKTAGNAYEHITLNERQFPPFADVNLRRALIHALDRELYVRTILDGLTTVAHGPIQPISWAYSETLTRYRFDPERSRRLLDQAGWVTGADGIRTRNGKRLAFTLITQAGYAIRENIAQAVQRQLRDIGVDVRVELQDGTAISSIWFEGKFDAMLHWWQMPSDPELTTFFAADRTPPAGRNINYYRNDELTELVYAADRAVDRDRRRTLLQRAQAIITDDVPEIPLYNVTRLDAVPASLRNFKGNPTNTGIFWNVYEWEIK